MLDGRDGPQPRPVAGPEGRQVSQDDREEGHDLAIGYNQHRDLDLAGSFGDLGRSLGNVK